MTTERVKVLAVDDSENDLELLSDALFSTPPVARGMRAEPVPEEHKFADRIELRLAGGAESALATLKQDGPFAVIISDMGMPGMDGATLLHRVAALTPDTVRIMVTGNKDQDTAAAAVNDGQIFRFLTKPFETNALHTALAAALRQHELLTAERDLLAGTLSGAVRVMIELLSLARPIAFGRATRLRNLARDVGMRLGYEPLWELELAATLSQIGFVAVPDETLRKLFSGHPLGPEEIAARLAYSAVGADLVASVPRLDAVAEIIRHQEQPSGLVAGGAGRHQPSMGSRVLNVCIDYDLLLQQGQSQRVALNLMQQRGAKYDEAVFNALTDAVTAVAVYARHRLKPRDLEPGMVLAEDLVTESGATLMREGEEFTSAALARVRGVLRGPAAERAVSVLVFRTADKDTGAGLDSDVRRAG